eukprot:2283502-Rhodomonas_salina.2
MAQFLVTMLTKWRPGAEIEKEEGNRSYWKWTVYKKKTRVSLILHPLPAPNLITRAPPLCSGRRKERKLSVFETGRELQHARLTERREELGTARQQGGGFDDDDDDYHRHGDDDD